MLSTFDWPGGRETFAESLGRVVGEVDRAGVEHVWLMDHLRQIPQLGPAWHDLPDPFTTLAWIAARTERVRLGVLVTPAFLRPPALLAKSIATLDVVSGGRAICGLGVGWFAAEYAAAGIAFPGLAARYHALRTRSVRCRRSGARARRRSPGGHSPLARRCPTRDRCSTGCRSGSAAAASGARWRSRPASPTAPTCRVRPTWSPARSTSCAGTATTPVAIRTRSPSRTSPPH